MTKSGGYLPFVGWTVSTMLASIKPPQHIPVMHHTFETPLKATGGNFSVRSATPSFRYTRRRTQTDGPNRATVPTRERLPVRQARRSPASARSRRRPSPRSHLQPRPLPKGATSPHGWGWLPNRHRLAASGSWARSHEWASISTSARCRPLDTMQGQPQPGYAVPPRDIHRPQLT
jgi:hypothetical protein